MDAEQPLTRPEADALLHYVEATYRAVTAPQRRVAMAALVLAALFGVLTLIGGVQWLRTRARIDDVADKPLVEALGVAIPDPRPAMERAQLRIQALVWGVAGVAAAMLGLLFSAVYAVARPPGGLRGPLRQPPAGRSP
jgi:hypothetical protein